MSMFDISHWLIFLSAAIAINISPGPDMIYILSKTIAQGHRIGIASTLGVCSGALFHVVAAALGISAILATSAIAFSIVKYSGATYLIYLGIKALCSKGNSFDVAVGMPTKTTFWEAFKQGALIDILNPKVAIFFMAFLPQFVRPEFGKTSHQLLVLGLLVILIAIVIELLIVLLAAKTSYFFQTNRRFTVWLDRILGTVLIGLGLRLVFTRIEASN